MGLFEKVRAEIEPIVAGFPRFDPADRVALVRSMEVCYTSMVASEPLLELAASVPGPFQEYFKAHVEEERGHEVWMAKDIAALGGTIEGLEPCEEIVTMCGEQYYLVRHVSPVALLGYMAVIEGFPNSPEGIAELHRLYGDAAFTLAYHAANDVEHGKDLAEVIDQVPPAQHALVLRSAIRTAELYGSALWRLYF